MAYVYERFGEYNITRLGQKLDAAGVEVVTVPQVAPFGGALDGLGNRRARPSARTLAVTFVLNSQDGSLEGQLNTVLALAGKRDKLYRRGDDGDVQWVTARLRKVSAPRDRSRTFWLEVTCEFEVYSANWSGDRHGSGWFFDDGESFDTGLTFDEVTGDVFTLAPGAATVCAVTNGGNDVATNARLTITAGSAAITGVIISAEVDTGSIYLLFNATVAAGTSLIIDQARLMVTVDGLDARGNLVRHTSLHTIAEWLRLPDGSTAVSIELVGGGSGSQAVFEFWDGWAL